jgi:hypothetical protein
LEFLVFCGTATKFPVFLSKEMMRIGFHSFFFVEELTIKPLAVKAWCKSYSSFALSIHSAIKQKKIEKTFVGKIIESNVIKKLQRKPMFSLIHLFH